MSTSTKALRVLVVGQTPPPFGGQAVMIAKFLEGRYTGMQLHHVRMAFSAEMSDVGRFQVHKLWVLVRTIAAIWVARFRHRPTVLYYPPSGPNMVPVLRDIVLLLSVRWLFRRTVFHFHAGGLSTFAPRLPWLLRPLFRLAYRKPDLAIRLSPIAPEDGRYFGARQNVLVPNGIEDVAGGAIAREHHGERTVAILFTAVLIPSKGVEVLTEAFVILAGKGLNVELRLMGAWGDAEVEQRCMERITNAGLTERVKILGVRTGEVKDADFRDADIFCFPSHFEAEVFPVVVMEASQYSLPIVATRWRGIPLMVEDGRNAFLVEPEDPQAVANELEKLVRDPALRASMGREGRRIFQERFALERHLQLMEQALLGMPR
jgi:glycosyltransferase involved in cell wall biosynthesis